MATTRKIPTKMFEVFPTGAVHVRLGDRKDDKGVVIGEYEIREQECLISLPGSEAVHTFTARIPDGADPYVPRSSMMIDPSGRGNGFRNVRLEGSRYDTLAYVFDSPTLVAYSSEYTASDEIKITTNDRRASATQPPKRSLSSAASAPFKSAAAE
jgi:hypothetical protein